MYFCCVKDENNSFKMNPRLPVNMINLVKFHLVLTSKRPSKILNLRNYCLLTAKNTTYFDKNGNKFLIKNKHLEHQSLLLLSTTGSSGNRKVFFSWKTFLISGVLVSIFALVMIQMKNEKFRQMEKRRKKALGEAAVGGKFDLIDQDGRRFTSDDLDGRWALIYFGFTHCPDVCPDELEKIVKAVDLISVSKDADAIQPVFITVDPERDSIKAVREYIREFSPKFIGLTGSKEQVNQATRAYRVYYSAGPRDHEDDYIVDHTIITYLINPEGQLVDYFGQTKTAEDMAQGVIKAMVTYRDANRKLGFL